ncbi:multicopper oxidase family protein [Acetobacter fallax]|uniref:Multicopper oxidase domain-containing protein n=1 Tax=Acetobacter fallax TaxID=1737473 RepID=A0ABX0K8V8_9PROT|nr:multicopper oxidase domain-containing protein [Acetobacter fallax]NHO32809.1 multicopper oxidase domain-containing protein [Acetobacter fallax]NHO36407.1 multicopper oxidase domain-containing protein [Acetobacter fallax]
MSPRSFFLTGPLPGLIFLFSPLQAHQFSSEEANQVLSDSTHSYREPAHPSYWSSRLPEAQSTCGAGSVRRSGSTVTANLDLAYSRNRIWNPAENRNDTVRLRSYNGCLAAPTIVVSPGDDLHINLTNNLPDEPTDNCPKTINTPSCFNHQNLHLHGMHVSPQGHSDNVMHAILPQGGRWNYRYAIPSDHPAGTFWYHAHEHGATSIGVASGEEGVLIVGGKRRYTDRKNHGGVADLDTILHDSSGEPIPERIMLFEQIPYGCFTDKTYKTLMQDETTGIWQCPKNADGVVENFHSQFIGSRTDPDGTSRDAWQLSRRYTLVNGETQPVLNTRVGRVERWRMIAGGVHDTLNISIIGTRRSTAGGGPHPPSYAGNDAQAMTCDGETVAQYEIAEDGLTRQSVSRKDINYLFPGQRSDALVTFRKPGLYCVVDQGGSTLNTVIPLRSRPEGKSPALIAVVSVAPEDGNSMAQQPESEARIRKLFEQGSEGLPSFVRARLALFDLSDFAYFPPGGEPGSDLSMATVTHRPTAFFGSLSMPLAAGASLPADQPMPDTSINGMIGLVENDLVKINGVSALPFSMDPTHSYHVRLGDVDEWRIGTHTMGTGTSAGQHVFHIHVNPVEIMDIVDETTGESIFTAGGQCRLQYRLNASGNTNDASYSPEYCDQRHVFRDSLFVKPGFQTVVRTRYDDFPGDVMLHCHILDHEDQGMMTYVTVE